MRMIFSNKLTLSSSTTIKKKSPWSLRGRSFAMTRSGVIYLPREPLKRENVRTVHSPQHLKQLTTTLVKRMRERIGPLVLRQPSVVVRSQWKRGRGCVNLSRCGPLSKRI
ncbi:hypothetical protein YC2023_040534 [Brassica napus]